MSYFIAEVSSNHSNDLDRIFNFVDLASNIGANAVKFQLFKVDQLFSKEILSSSPEHRKRKAWELSEEFIPLIHDRCKKKNIDFSCTPFYLDAVTILEPYVDFYKVASYELLWDELLIKCAKTNKPVIISTGMANMNEINHAVDVLRKGGCNDIKVLHCCSSYPAPIEQVNLKAIETIRKATNLSVGWSDHTAEPSVIYRAVNTWDASVIEFHLDIEGYGEEFESGHCWLPKDIESVIQNINNGKKADGEGVKEPVDSELPDRLWRADPGDGLRPFISIRKTFNKNDEQ